MANTIKIGNIEASAIMIGNSAVSAVYIGSTKIYPSGGTVDYSKQYLTFVALEDSTFKLTSNAVNYSLDDGQTWTALASGSASTTVTAGNKIMWKGELTPTSSNGIGNFSATGRFEAQGNVMSLLFGDDFTNKTDLTGKDYAFYNLFNQNTNIKSAENLILPATTLADSCYSCMFIRCTNLTTTPELPATTLADWCYANMFQNCTSLVTAPELPAKTLASNCYDNMFKGCTSLTTAPVLPATTLTFSCYAGMFNGCTSLKTAPELPATTLANYCYNSMFGGCKGLTSAPALPATTLASGCYANMFNGCTSLVNAPELPATTLASSCYDYMFYGCTKINYIKAMFTTTPGTNYTGNWVNGVASTGTFVKNSAATWNVTGINGVPTGWTVQNIN